MNLNRIFPFALGLAALGLLGSAVRAHDDKKPGDAAKEAEKAAPGKDAAPKMSPEEQKMMEMMMKLGTPGEHHKNLAQLEGKWNAVMKMRWSAESPWDESKGVIDYRMVLGGRWLHMMYKGESGGQPFEGAGSIGYDNGMKKYVSSWMDSMSTSCMMTYGDCDASHKVITFHGEMPDPSQDNKMTKYRTVLTMVDKDKHTYQMYCPNKDGKGEYLCMEITYTRAK